MNRFLNKVAAQVVDITGGGGGVIVERERAGGNLSVCIGCSDEQHVITAVNRNGDAASGEFPFFAGELGVDRRVAVELCRYGVNGFSFVEVGFDEASEGTVGVRLVSTISGNPSDRRTSITYWINLSGLSRYFRRR